MKDLLLQMSLRKSQNIFANPRIMFILLISGNFREYGSEWGHAGIHHTDGTKKLHCNVLPTPQGGYRVRTTKVKKISTICPRSSDP